MRSLEAIERYIDILKSKLDSSDLKASLNSIFNKEQSTYKRYLVDFYILFQILQRYSYKDLDSITFSDLKEKMALVQKEIKNPSEIDDSQTYQDHFSDLLSIATKIG